MVFKSHMKPLWREVEESSTQIFLRKTHTILWCKWGRFVSDMAPVYLRDLLSLGDMGKDEFKFVSSKHGHEYMSATTEEPTRLPVGFEKTFVC